MPVDPQTEMGAMITKAARSRVVDMVERAAGDGARVLTGGKAIEEGELGDGAFLEPTVVDHVARGSELADVEVFDKSNPARLRRLGQHLACLPNPILKFFFVDSG